MSNRIEDLHPIVQKKLNKLRELATAEGILFSVSHTLRTKTEQNALYAKGRTIKGKIVTNASYPYSFHNHGVAFDVVPLVNGEATWARHDLFNRLGEIGESVGLEWGGRWKGLVDQPHFQYTQGRTIEDFIKGYKLTPIPMEKTPEQIAFEKEVAEARLRAIAKGITNGERPKDPISREEFWVMEMRAGRL